MPQAKEKMKPQPIERGSSTLEVVFTLADLEALVNKVSLAVSSISPNEVLRHILIQASKEQGVAFAGTDQELSVIARSTSPTVVAEGSVVLPLKDLASIVSLSEDVVTMQVNEGVATFSSADAVWVCQSALTDLFPDIPGISDSARPLSSKGLQRVLEAVSPAICRDESRPSLMMVSFDGEGAYATDGSRVHFGAFQTDFNGLQIPLAAVKPLQSLLKVTSEDYIYIDMNDTHVIFLIGMDEFSSRILDAQFPSVKQSMIDPRLATHSEEIVLPRERLRLALRRASAISDDGSGSVTIRLSSKTCVLAAVNVKGSRVASSVETGYEGQIRQSTYLIQSLQDVLGVVGEETVTLRMSPSVADGSLLIRSQTETFILLPRVKV